MSGEASSSNKRSAPSPVDAPSSKKAQQNSLDVDATSRHALVDDSSPSTMDSPSMSIASSRSSSPVPRSTVPNKLSVDDDLSTWEASFNVFLKHDEGKWQITFDNVVEGTTIDNIFRTYGRCIGFLGHSSHVSPDGSKAFINFETEDDYERALTIDPPTWGALRNGDDYDPTVEHSKFWRMFLHCLDFKLTNPWKILDSVQRRIGVRPSNITLNTVAGCAIIYFENSADWLEACKHSCYNCEPMKEGEEYISARVVLAFSATSDPQWTKLYVGGLPKGSSEKVVKSFFEHIVGAVGCVDLVGMARNRYSGALYNYGFMFISAGWAVDTLLGHDGTSLKGKKVRIQTARAKAKDNTAAAAADASDAGSLLNSNATVNV